MPEITIAHASRHWWRPPHLPRGVHKVRKPTWESALAIWTIDGRGGDGGRLWRRSGGTSPNTCSAEQAGHRSLWGLSWRAVDGSSGNGLAAACPRPGIVVRRPPVRLRILGHSYSQPCEGPETLVGGLQALQAGGLSHAGSRQGDARWRHRRRRPRCRWWSMPTIGPQPYRLPLPPKRVLGRAEAPPMPPPPSTSRGRNSA